MSERLYPISLAELDAWRRANSATLDEARKRFAQFVVLECLALAGVGKLLCFKGGNALRFVFGNPRSTVDLDFTALPGFPDDEEGIRKLMQGALSVGVRRFTVKARCQRVHRNPRGADRTHPTYEVSIGYQLPGDRHFDDFDHWDRPLITIVELEISLNDEVCEARGEQLSPQSEVRIHTCVLEDILAEKLRALLQQPIRKRNRRQDVYDIARMLTRHDTGIDLGKVAHYFVRKCRARGIEPTLSAFDEEVRRRAAFDYETLFSQSDPNYIPFEQAWKTVVECVRGLKLRQTQ